MYFVIVENYKCVSLKILHLMDHLRSSWRMPFFKRDQVKNGSSWYFWKRVMCVIGVWSVSTPDPVCLCEILKVHLVILSVLCEVSWAIAWSMLQRSRHTSYSEYLTSYIQSTSHYYVGASRSMWNNCDDEPVLQLVTFCNPSATCNPSVKFDVVNSAVMSYGQSMSYFNHIWF